MKIFQIRFCNLFHVSVQQQPNEMRGRLNEVSIINIQRCCSSVVAKVLQVQQLNALTMVPREDTRLSSTFSWREEYTEVQSWERKQRKKMKPKSYHHADTIMVQWILACCKWWNSRQCHLTKNQRNCSHSNRKNKAFKVFWRSGWYKHIFYELMWNPLEFSKNVVWECFTSSFSLNYLIVFYRPLHLSIY